MAASECTVSGTLYDLGADAAYAKLIFQLTADYDVEPNAGAVLNRRDIVTVTDGTFSIGLWPNSEGYASTRYSVKAVIYEDSSFDVALAVLDLGNIEVPNTTTADIADLLPIQAADQGSLTLIAGDSFTVDVYYTYDDGSPQSLSGVTPSSSVLIDGTLEDLTATVIDEDAGHSQLSWISTETTDFTPGSWPWDVKYEHSGGDVSRVKQHNLIITERVTE